MLSYPRRNWKWDSMASFIRLVNMSEFSALGPKNHVPTAAYGLASIERLEKAFCLWMNIGKGPFRFLSLFSAFPRVVFFRGENIIYRSFEGIYLQNNRIRLFDGVNYGGIIYVFWQCFCKNCKLLATLPLSSANNKKRGFDLHRHAIYPRQRHKRHALNSAYSSDKQRQAIQSRIREQMFTTQMKQV